MNVDAAPHVLLRLVLVEVWSLLFGDMPPACLRFAPDGPLQISHVDTLPAYVPSYQIEKREAERKRKKEEEERRKEAESNRTNSLKLNLSTTQTGAITHSRHLPGAGRASLEGGGGGVLALTDKGSDSRHAARPLSRIPKTVRWELAGAHDVQAEQERKIVKEYMKLAEKWVSFDNDVNVVTGPAVGAVPSGGLPDASY